MIRIERPDDSKPEHLDKEEVLQETQDAIDLFDPARDDEPGIEEKRKKFKFEKYSHPTVKDALIKLSNEKCAYCETRSLHVYYGDIEHFRPKKEVGESKKEMIRPGYYWLANSWDNLFLSCLFCNQAKKQLVKWEEEGEKKEKRILIGKQNKFPLADEDLYGSRRDFSDWEAGGKAEDEAARLLIDPCKDEPEEHLAYTKEGVIRPKKLDDGKASAKGRESIRVYALQRHYLVQERKKHLIPIFAQMQRVRDAITRLNEEQRPVIQSYYRNKIDEEKEFLLLYTLPDRQFAGMARQFVYAFCLEELKMTETQLRNSILAVEENREMIEGRVRAGG